MKPDIFIDILTKSGFGPFIGVPCSFFKDLIDYINTCEEIDYYLASSEGEAMGMAGGFFMTGRLPVVLMQSDGYGNALNPISTLQILYKLPCLLLISWRGEPGMKDAPQHSLVGSTIDKLLSTFEIPYTVMENRMDSLKESVTNARNFIDQVSRPYVFLIKKGYFESFRLKSIEKSFNLEVRASYLRVLKSLTENKDVFIGTTGFTGREMQQLFEHSGKFYMMGSMGCASSIGLAIAIERPNHRIFVLDGDGALLMKMGTIPTIGYYAPKNLIHICFDNNQYESTGGQETSSSKVDFPAVAFACGYNTAEIVDTVNSLKNIIFKIRKINGPHFIHVKIKSGTMKDLPRPSEKPEEIKESFMSFLKK